jgi:PqqD family protein of HPr-rel-A system
LFESAQRWRTVPAEALAWRELDGEVVVHNARSGSTHLLEPLAGEVLRALIEEQSGMSVPDLVGRLRESFGEDDFADWFAAVERVLTEFERLGLAESEQP